MRVPHSIPATFGLLAIASLLAMPSTAEAQRGRDRDHRGPAVGGVVVIGPRYVYPGYGFFDPWYQWGPYPPYGYYGYPYRGEAGGALRIQVSPKQAEVYVDGYLAGHVDDFDGVFQRLDLPRGGHQIVIYLEGYRPYEQNVYVANGQAMSIKQALVPLAPGEAQPPRPVPMAPPPGRGGTRGPQPPPAAPPQPPGTPPAYPPAGPPAEPDRAFGSLAILVQPPDATILIDGERWSMPAGQDRLVVRLADGRHHVEVSKEGFSTYTEDVLIRRGATMNLNVSLIRDVATIRETAEGPW